MRDEQICRLVAAMSFGGVTPAGSMSSRRAAAVSAWVEHRPDTSCGLRVRVTISGS